MWDGIVGCGVQRSGRPGQCRCVVGDVRRGGSGMSHTVYGVGVLCVEVRRVEIECF